MRINCSLNKILIYRIVHGETFIGKQAFSWPCDRNADNFVLFIIVSALVR